MRRGEGADLPQAPDGLAQRGVLRGQLRDREGGLGRFRPAAQRLQTALNRTELLQAHLIVPPPSLSNARKMSSMSPIAAPYIFRLPLTAVRRI